EEIGGAGYPLGRAPPNRARTAAPVAYITSPAPNRFASAAPPISPIRLFVASRCRTFRSCGTRARPQASGQGKRLPVRLRLRTALKNGAFASQPTTGAAVRPEFTPFRVSATADAITGDESSEARNATCAPALCVNCRDTLTHTGRGNDNLRTAIVSNRPTAPT